MEENKTEDLMNETISDKCIEELILQKTRRPKLYVVYDIHLNKWKAVKENGKRAIRTANTRMGLIKDLSNYIKKEDYEIVVVKKSDVRKAYNEANKKD